MQLFEGWSHLGTLRTAEVFICFQVAFVTVKEALQLTCGWRSDLYRAFVV